VHVVTENGSDTKESINEELECAFDEFPTKILLGVFYTEVEGEDIFNPAVGNESLREISNDDRVGVVNFAT
jgi:hypothetical protein